MPTTTKIAPARRLSRTMASNIHSYPITIHRPSWRYRPSSPHFFALLLFVSCLSPPPPPPSAPRFDPALMRELLRVPSRVTFSGFFAFDSPFLGLPPLPFFSACSSFLPTAFLLVLALGFSCSSSSSSSSSSPSSSLTSSSSSSSFSTSLAFLRPLFFSGAPFLGSFLDPASFS
ncbi:hypothetical protein BKA80DRAFT_52145 [Phyllosticta citrichinensis]